MEPIELLSCAGCQRIVDQWTMFPKCKRCGTKMFRQVRPTKYMILCWFLNQPKHVAKLYLQDLREKYHAKRG